MQQQRVLDNDFFLSEYGVPRDEFFRHIQEDKFLIPCDHALQAKYPQYNFQGDYFLSAGNAHLYRVESYPVCRLYWQRQDDPDLNPRMRKYYEQNGFFSKDGIALTSWTTESSWVEGVSPKQQVLDLLLKTCEMPLVIWFVLILTNSRKKNCQFVPNHPSYEATLLIDGEPVIDLNARLKGDYTTYKTSSVTLRWEATSCQNFATLQEIQQESIQFLSSRKVRPQQHQFSSELIAAMLGNSPETTAA